MPKKFWVVGVDVGGTNIKIGLVDPSGRVKARTSLATKIYHRSKKRLIESLANGIEDLLKIHGLSKKDVKGIGFGLPGLIDPPAGIVKFLPNIPGWKNVPLRRILQARLNIPVFLENDVNLITLGEWKFGAGRGVKNLICITLGTGVGGGLIFDNELYRGEGFVAGEIGHMPLNEKGLSCPCGGIACYERYVGNRALQRKAAGIFRRKTALEEVSALAAAGDLRARRFWEETGALVGQGLIGVVNLLNPRVIVIGGGISRSFRFLSKAVARAIKGRAMTVQAAMVKVVRAQLGDEAGIRGAHVLVNQQTHPSSPRF